MSARPTPAAPFLAVLPLLILSEPSMAATVVGRVRSALDGAPVPSATILLAGTRRGATTGEDGHFRITDVPEGLYELRIRHSRGDVYRRQFDIRAGTNDVGDLAIEPPPPPPPPPPQVDIGTRTNVRAKDLVATIRAPRAFAVGDIPWFEVRIENRSPEPVVLVRRVDGSNFGGSPQVTIRIDGPRGGFVFGAVHSDKFGVSTDDFVTVQSGKSFDPYSKGSWGDELLWGSSRSREPTRRRSTIRR